MITHKGNTFAGFWKMTKENTWYGYKVTDNFYEWWKTKATAIKHMPDKKSWLLRGTLIRGEMYINHHYAKMGGF